MQVFPETSEAPKRFGGDINPPAGRVDPWKQREGL